MQNGDAARTDTKSRQAFPSSVNNHVVGLPVSAALGGGDGLEAHWLGVDTLKACWVVADAEPQSCVSLNLIRS